MNIKVPSDMKSPTVIIVGERSTDEHDKMKSDMHMKRMDNLERKLDQQYKVFTDKKDYIRLFERLHKSFMDKYDKFISVHRDMMNGMNENRFKDIHNKFTSQINNLLKHNSNDEMLRVFTRRIGSLENTIKNMPSPEVKVVRTSSGNSALQKSFLEALDKIHNRLGKIMIPHGG